MKKKLYLMGVAATTIAILFLVFGLVKNKPSTAVAKAEPKEEVQNQGVTVNELSNNNLIDLIASKQDVFIYFYQPKCHFCTEADKVLKPLVSNDKVKFYQFDLSKAENKEGWTKYAIKGTPTILRFKDGKEINRMEGLVSEDSYQLFFNQKM